MERLSRPAHGKGTEDVAVRNDEDVAFGVLPLGLPDDGLVVLFADLTDEAVQPVVDVLRHPTSL